MNTSESPLSEPLRRAIVESGFPFLQIQEKTGVDRASISRFVAGDRSLRLDLADKLAAFFGLILRGDPMSSPPTPAPPRVMANREEAYQSFFQALAKNLEEHDFTKLETGKPWSWGRFKSGEPQWARYGAAFAHGEVRAYVLIACKLAAENTRILNELKKQRTDIEQEFGSKLEWDFRRNTAQQQGRIEIHRPGSIQDNAKSLEEIKAWMIDRLCKLRTVFKPRLAELAQ